MGDSSTRFDPYGPDTVDYGVSRREPSRFDPYGPDSVMYSSSEFPRADEYEVSTATKRDHRSSRDTSYDGPFDDQRFVEQASRGGLLEVESSRIALERRSSDETRKFARMMIDDHTKTNQELASLALTKNLRAASELDEVHREKLDELRRLDGVEFDRKYRECQIKAHDQAIALFARAARDCRDPELRAFAERTLPKLREHRSHLTPTAIEIRRDTGSGS